MVSSQERKSYHQSEIVLIFALFYQVHQLMSRQIFLRNYELYSGIPGFTGVIQRVTALQLAVRYPHITLDVNNYIRENMEEMKTGLRELNKKGKIQALPKIQLAIEKTIRNAALLVNKISTHSANKIVWSAMFDGDLPKLQGSGNETAKMWYDSYQNIRREIVDRIAACYLSCGVKVFSAPEEADHQIIKDAKEKAGHPIDIVYSQDKIFIHNKIPTLIHHEEEGGELYCYVIDIAKWNPDRIKKKDLLDFIKMLNDPYKVALFQAVRCNSKYNGILRYYTPGQLIDQPENVPLPVRSECVRRANNIDQFFQLIEQEYPNVEISQDYRVRTRQIVILHLFAWCYSRKNRRLQFLNPELLKDGIFTLDQVISVLHEKKKYDQLCIVKRLKENGLSFQAPTSDKQRKERLNFYSYCLTVRFEQKQCEVNDLFYRTISHLKFQQTLENARSRYPRVAIDLLQGVGQTLSKIDEQFRRMGNQYLTFLSEVQQEINQECIKEIIVNAYLLQQSNFQVIGFIDAKKYASKSNTITSEYSTVYIDGFWKKFVKMVFLAVEAMSIEVRIVDELDTDYQILNSFNRKEVDAVYSKKEFFVLHKVPILFNFGMGKETILEFVDLRAPLNTRALENQSARKFTQIAANPQKRAIYHALQKCATLDCISNQFRRFVYPRMIEKLAWECDTLQEVIDFIKTEHFSHIHLSDQNYQQIQAEMHQISRLDIALASHRNNYPLSIARQRRGRMVDEYQKLRVFGELMKRKYLFLSSMMLDKRTINLSVAQEQFQNFHFN